MAKLLPLPPGITFAHFDQRQLRRGTKHELEHTGSKRAARLIAAHHLLEDPHYYTHLEAMERKVARGAKPRKRCTRCRVTMLAFSERSALFIDGRGR